MNIGNAIKTVRKEKGITQLSLCMKTGLSQKTMSNIENQKVEPEKETVLKICSALEIPPTYLMMLSLTVDDVEERKKEAFLVIKQAAVDLVMSDLKS